MRCLIFTYVFLHREFTTENLRFLNIDQALADLAYFIVEMKKQSRFAESPVVLYGGSYAANMVMWFKKKYPHLAVGTVASSGPILAKVDFTGTYLLVNYCQVLLKVIEPRQSIRILTLLADFSRFK